MSSSIQLGHTTIMLLISAVLMLISTRSFGEEISCPYMWLTPLTTRFKLARLQNYHRRSLMLDGRKLPPAKLMYKLEYNCETEYNLGKILEQLPDENSTVTYRNFGVNIGTLTSPCSLFEIHYVVSDWANEQINVPSSLEYEGNTNILNYANMVKWNATEVGCALKINPKEDSARVICAYNVKGGVSGEAIYEKATGGNNSCDEGAQCGSNGTCDNLLCNVPTSNPDTLLAIYKPSLSCTNLSFMSQFSRYYALNQHNYYRRLVASGWAENKLTRFAPRAARMEALAYDCLLEEAANENVKKCERSPTGSYSNLADYGRNIEIIEDINISGEAALERATGEWFSQLSNHGVDPNSSWKEDSTVKNCANIIHDKYNAVGCAVNKCSSQGFTIVECRYGPKRLQEGGSIYDVGLPCSKCAASQKCLFDTLCQ